MQAAKPKERSGSGVGRVGCVSVRGGGGRYRRKGVGTLDREEGRKEVRSAFVHPRPPRVGRRVGRNYGRAAELRRLELRRARALSS